MTALASQVIWTRTLSLLFGATVYTFSLILAVFLFGIGIGSSVGSVLARGLERPRLALGWVQMLLCGAIAWAAYTLALSLPFWPINPSISTSPWYNFPLDLARAFWVVLPASILWGASFPLALASVAVEGAGSRPAGRRRLRRQHRRRDRRRHRRQPADGHAGSGTQHSQQALIILSGLAALLVLEPLQSSTEAGRPRSAWAGTLPIVVGAVVAALLARNVPPIPKLLVAYGRYAATRAHAEHRRHLHGRGLERLGRRHAAAGRRPQLSQRRQGAGLERAAGHAPAAHARPHDDAHPEEPEEGARHRLRRGRHRRRGLDRPVSRARDDRRDRAARAARSSRPTSPSTTSTSSPTRRCTSSSTTRGTI